MRPRGPRVLSRSMVRAACRLAVIEQEVEQILRAFPDLRHQSRGVRLPHTRRSLNGPGLHLVVRPLAVHRVH